MGQAGRAGPAVEQPGLALGEGDQPAGQVAAQALAAGPVDQHMAQEADQPGAAGIDRLGHGQRTVEEAAAVEGHGMDRRQRRADGAGQRQQR